MGNEPEGKSPSSINVTHRKITDIAGVYVGGDLLNIEVKDLVGNEVAIKQLINNHNDQAKKCIDAERKLENREREIEHLKTAPFVAITGAIIGVTGTVVVGIGVNLSTASPPHGLGPTIMYLGGGLVIVAAVMNILFPFARKWFNKKS